VQVDSGQEKRANKLFLKIEILLLHSQGMETNLLANGIEGKKCHDVSRFRNG